MLARREDFTPIGRRRGPLFRNLIRIPEIPLATFKMGDRGSSQNPPGSKKASAPREINLPGK
jgi:hypothetical protein